MESNALREIERKDAERLSDYQVKLAEKTAQKIQEEYERVYGLVNARVNDFVDAMANALEGEKDAWRNWADAIIKEITRVLLKKALLAGLNALFPGAGFIGSIAGMMTGSQSSTIQVITADPATTVRFINGAYNQAPAGDRARLAQMVGRGNMVNVRR
jgi:phage-related minor tail protein